MANPVQNDRGFRDSDLLVAGTQAIPLTGLAVNGNHCVDKALAAPKIEAGIPVKLKVKVTTVFGLSAGTPTLDFGIITQDSAPSGTTWSGRRIIAPGVVRLSGAAAAGKVYEGYLPSKPGLDYQRYIGIMMTPSTSGFSSGAVDAWIDFD